MSDIIYRGLTAEDLDDVILFAEDMDYFGMTQDGSVVQLERAERVCTACKQIQEENKQ